jgi:hypothetical protein
VLPTRTPIRSGPFRPSRAYVESYKLGFATGFIPKEYGGGGISNLDLQIVVEELTAVDPGFATILLVNGLALMPLVWLGSEAQKQKWLVPATSDPRGEYLAGWTVSEPAGTPGGTANFDGPAPYPAGIGLTAVHDKKNGEYVLNGRKFWRTRDHEYRGAAQKAGTTIIRSIASSLTSAFDHNNRVGSAVVTFVAKISFIQGFRHRSVNVAA